MISSYAFFITGHKTLEIWGGKVTYNTANEVPGWDYRANAADPTSWHWRAENRP